MSDSSYTARIRHRQSLQSTAGRPPQLDIIDDAWASATLSDDDIDVERHEVAVASMLDEEGDLDGDAAFVSTAHSGSAADGAAERRRKEEGRWNDLALDQFDTSASNSAGTGSGQGNQSRPNRGGP